MSRSSVGSPIASTLMRRRRVASAQTKRALKERIRSVSVPRRLSILLRSAQNTRSILEITVSAVGIGSAASSSTIRAAARASGMGHCRLIPGRSHLRENISPFTLSMISEWSRFDEYVHVRDSSSRRRCSLSPTDNVKLARGPSSSSVCDPAGTFSRVLPNKGTGTMPIARAHAIGDSGFHVAVVISRPLDKTQEVFLPSRPVSQERNSPTSREIQPTWVSFPGHYSREMTNRNGIRSL